MGFEVMKHNIKYFVALLTITCVFSNIRAVAEPFDSQGNVGATNYRTIPFQSSIYGSSWGASVDLTPGMLFILKNQNSFYHNLSNVTAAQIASETLNSAGIVPFGGAQRWEDTYAASFPAGTFPNEPSYVNQDRINGNFPNLPEFVAWRNFVQTHPQYWATDYTGGTVPGGTTYPDYPTWGAQWGFISPFTPLDPADCPRDMSSGCTWGDFFAHRWSMTSKLSHAYGILLADFANSQPGRSTNYIDFNPRIVAAFATKYGYTSKLSAMTTPEQATWITKNAFSQWTDFVGTGYGNFFNALATRISTATHKAALVIGGGDTSPAWNRLEGVDNRLIATQMNPKNYLAHWDNQVIQVGRAGPVAVPPMWELGGAVLSAAREPLIRNGYILEADDAAYWSAIASFYPTLSSSAQTEVGYRLLKRLWLWTSWAHIADRSGQTRRAVAYASRDYWDAGSLSALDPLTSLIQKIVPTQPLGPALYYSVNAERAAETAGGKAAGPGNLPGIYLPPQDLQTFIDAGGAVGYYVSDVALPSIAPGSAAAPSAWIVLDAPKGYLTSTEESELAAIAPVIRESSTGSEGAIAAATALAARTDQPLSFSAGLTGFGFYDQHGRRTVVVSNPSSAPNAASISGTIMLRMLPKSSGHVKVINLLTNEVTTVSATGGTASIPVLLQPWDTAVFAANPTN